MTEQTFTLRLVRAERAAGDLAQGTGVETDLERALRVLRARARAAYADRDPVRCRAVSDALMKIEAEVQVRVQSERGDFRPRPAVGQEE